MAEYKAKLLKDLFVQAKKVLLNDGSNVEDVLTDIIKTHTATKSYVLPTVGSNVDVSFTLSTPVGYQCIGIINYITNTGNALANGALSNSTTGFLTITNISNSGQVGTTRMAQWTEVYIKA